MRFGCPKLKGLLDRGANKWGGVGGIVGGNSALLVETVPHRGVPIEIEKGL
jgi:hypothetical protein